MYRCEMRGIRDTVKCSRVNEVSRDYGLEGGLHGGREVVKHHKACGESRGKFCIGHVVGIVLGEIGQ